MEYQHIFSSHFHFKRRLALREVHTERDGDQENEKGNIPRGFLNSIIENNAKSHYYLKLIVAQPDYEFPHTLDLTKKKEIPSNHVILKI